MKKGMAGVIPVQSIYVSDGDRFVVSLTVSYSAEDLEAGGHPVSPRGAVEALRDFIEDGDPPENIYVLDRQAKEAHFEPWEAAEDSSEEEDF